MSVFSSFFRLELKRFLNKKNVIILLIFFLLSIYLVYVGVIEYKDIVEKGKEFQKIEATMFGRLLNYQQYSIQGIRLLFLPTSPTIFFQNSNLFSDLYSRINQVISLSIGINSKSKSLFTLNTPNSWDLSNTILIFGSLLVLLWGFKTFQNKEYLKFLSGFSSYKKSFISLLISRVIFILGTLLLLFIFFLVVLKIQGIFLADADLSSLMGFLLVSFIVLLSFFFIGIIIGTIKSKALGVFSLIAVWFCLLYLIPGILNTYIKQKSSSITTDYQTELEKIKIVTEFEKRCEEKAGEFNRDNIDMERQFVEEYWNKDYKQIEALEEQLKSEISDNIYTYRNIAMFTPTTLYQLTGNEVSSGGHENFLDFYSYLQDMKRKFVRFYIDRVFYNDPKELVSFIKGDENVFRGRSRLPGNFSVGLLINLFYIVVLLGAAYFRFKRYIFDIKDKNFTELTKLKLELERGKTIVLITADENFKSQVFTAMNGRDKRFTGNIKLDKEDLFSITNSKEMVYMCKPGDIPADIKTGDLVNLFARLFKLSKTDKAKLYLKLSLEACERKYFNQLDDEAKSKILFNLARLKKNQVYIINDFANSMPFKGLLQTSKELKKLKENKIAILYITIDSLLATKIANTATYLKYDPTIPDCFDDYELK